MSSFGCLVGGRIPALPTENQLSWLAWIAVRDMVALAGVVGLAAGRLYLWLGLRTAGTAALAASVTLLIVAFAVHRRARAATRPLHIAES